MMSEIREMFKNFDLSDFLAVLSLFASLPVCLIVLSCLTHQ
ncbi:hypothetical protein [Basilea psittacipulmonis]|nr:hypothetical protein [Basilea psittacipulmonis]